MCHIVICLGVALLLHPVTGSTQDDKQPLKLSKEDKDFFEQLFLMGLFDPQGAEWTVSEQVFNKEKYSSYFWKKGTEYFSTDGVGAKLNIKNRPVPVPASLESAIKERFHPTLEQWKTKAPATWGYLPRPHDLAYAAWAYRQGKEGLASELLETIRATHSSKQQEMKFRARNEEPSDLREALQMNLSWWAFVGMKNALEGWDDALVIQLHNKIQKHFRDSVIQRFPQGAEVLADVARRQKEGTLVKPELKALPNDFQKWTLTQKTEFLIKELENYSSMFHGSNLFLHELVEMGEDALPALFQCLEHDTRLTRSGAEGGIRPIANKDRFYVREIAFDAVRRILKSFPQVNIPYDPKRSKSEYYRLLGAEAKNYWEANKSKSQIVRYYESLCDLQGNHRTRALALKSLLAIQKVRYIDLPDVNTSSFKWPDAPRKLHGEYEQFQKPTVAEAILRAMDHDLKQKPYSQQAHELSNHGRYLHSYQCSYLVGLVYLGDRRIIPELLRREATATEFHHRLKLAMTLHKLGESKPLAKLAMEIAEGREPKAPFATAELHTISNTWDIKTLEETAFIQTLISAQLPETEQALMAFTKPTHPLYPYFASRFKLEHLSYNRDFIGHPYCLSFLRPGLMDTTLSGHTVHVEKSSLIQQSKNSKSSGSLYGELKDAANRRDQAEARRCDLQMMQMREVVFGLCEYHPLFKDSQQRFDRNLRWINVQTFRPMSRYEATQLNEGYGQLMPVFQPLTRAATKEDVESLRAVFFLEGDAQRIDMKLPAWMVLKKDVSQSNYVTRRGLILQAEELQGKKHYGVLYRDGVKTISEEEVLRIEPYVSEK